MTSSGTREASVLVRLAVLGLGVHAGCGALAGLSDFEDRETGAATTGSGASTSASSTTSTASASTGDGGGGDGGGAGGAGGGAGGSGGATCEGVECGPGGECRGGVCRGELRWTLIAGDLDEGEQDQGVESLAFQGDDLVVAGGFRESIAFGVGHTGRSDGEIFVGRVDDEGDVIDQERFSAAFDQRCGELYVGDAGISLAGHYAGDVSFPPLEAGSAAFSGRGYVVRFGSDLSGVALGTFGAGNLTDTKLLHLHGDTGGTFAAGSFASSVDAGETCGTFTNGGTRDALFMAIDHEGACTSAATIGSGGDDEGIALLPAGDARHMVVSCGGVCDFQGVELSALQTATACVVRSDADFTPESVTSYCFEELNISTAFDAVGGEDGAVYLAGATVRALRATPLVARVSFEDPDDPALAWATVLGNGDDADDDTHAAVRLARHADGRLRVAVTFTGPLEIDDLDVVLVAEGVDAAILELDGETGNVLSVRQIGGAGDVVPAALAIGPDERVCLGGAFTGAIDVGDGPRIGGAGYDAFVACWDD